MFTSVPEGEGEKIDLEVYNFIGAGGVALSIYNTDEELIQLDLCNHNSSLMKYDVYCSQVTTFHIIASEVLASVIYDSAQQEVVPTSPKHHPWIMAPNIETKASRDHQRWYQLTKHELSDIQHGKDSGRFSL
ncbi:hypothetical protein L2E82_01518 [Cichorium intybus]|uniref:Uncharacterized protein n=1 Tax=Cichorium intybus TaxID=13427 RepID=A0ACB9GZ39_CICIN|nr:hypothetical protein L2E82_01518 [Cichorium intybus]